MKIFTTNPTRFSGRYAFFLGALLVAASMAVPVAGQTAVDLGSAANFAVLATSTITNTGTTTINGDFGIDSAGAWTPGGATVNGTLHLNDDAATTAQNDLTLAYNDAAGQTPTTTYGAIFDLGGLSLTPGVYNDHSSFGITGTLTLDGGGDPNAVFVFQAGSTLIAEAGSVVSLINGAQACNVFWQVGSSATLNSNSIFKGNILAMTDITLNSGASVEGRVLARNGAVTLNVNVITEPVIAPILTVYKTMSVVWDPFNLFDNPKAIPGAVIKYIITVSNAAGGGSATSITVSDDLTNETSRIEFEANTFEAGKGIAVTAPNIGTPPGNTQWLTNAIGDGDQGKYDSNSVIVTGIDLAASQSATVEFRVTIK